MTAVAAAPDGLTGLSQAEVVLRIESGAVNRSSDPPGRSPAQILRANALTPINAIMSVLFVLVLISGNWRDGLFVGVVVSNTIVGVSQEAKARRELAKLQVMTESKATVVRDGERRTIDREQLVLDDVIVLDPGGQVPVDGRVLVATGLRLDESLLTGESDPVPKTVDDQVLSGSFVAAGTGRVVATAVGDASYAGTLSTEARVFNAAESHLRQAIDRILKWLTIIIPIASILLLLSLLNAEPTWQDALRGTVAAAVAMVPDGLVLLTSLAFVAGVVELTRRKALAKQLSTVEVLARVDVLCLDKTGTITTGNIAFAGLHLVGGHTESQARTILATMAAADESPNATMTAIAASVGRDAAWPIEQVEPFSSARKWSAVSTRGPGWLYLGAPELLLGHDRPTSRLVDELSEAGQRLVAVASSDLGPTGDDLPQGLVPVAIVELRDEIRPDADDILAYFADQDVTVKVISGDNPDTVDAIARRAGMHPIGEPIDARQLIADPAGLAASLERNDVFGRVAPRQKQDMVRALQRQGHVVAMTGDGVNDVLALKDADLGIAMGSGSAASRSVADLVLTDDSFATLPVVVREGRKVINNVERVANLFVTKAVYAVLLTLLIGLIGSPFPFLPRQLTLIGTFSIGIPGFFLALSPEVDRVRSGFLTRVLRFSVPAGIIAGITTFSAFELARRGDRLPLDEARTLATVTLLGIGLVVLLIAGRPIRPWKLVLAGAMASGYGLVLTVPFARRFFELQTLSASAWSIVTAAVAIAGAALVAAARFTQSRQALAPKPS